MAIPVIRRYITLFKQNRSVFVICVTTVISMLGQGIMSPVIPLLASQFGVSVAAVGFVVSAFGISRLFLNVPAGIIGERFGRRLLMTIGLMCNALGLVLTGTANSVIVMAVWRFVSGAGSAMYMTGAMSFIADISTSRNRGQLMSLQQGSLLLGTSLGPALGGFLADSLGLRWPFFVAAILSAMAALWIVSRLTEPRAASREPAAEEPPKQKAPHQSFWDFRVIGKLLGNPTFLLVSLFTMMVFFTRSGSRQTILPLLAVEKGGMSATQLGLLFTFMTVINLVLVLPAGALTDRFGRKAVIMPGALCSVAGLSIFALADNFGLFFAGGALLGIGTGLIGPAPAAYAADLAPAGKTGVTMGLYRTFGDVGLIVGPILLGFVADAFGDRFAGISGKGIAMKLNAALILLMAILLVVLGKETTGSRSDRGSGGPS
ncbi:MAG: MFS transporter [Spirochaetales bacterium]|nr:MFS transporter [Spirochaetales bacterium]